MADEPKKAPLSRRDLMLAPVMFGYFFLVITTFWILKPIKKTFFLSYYRTSGVDILGWHLSAPQGELIAKVANMAVAALAVIVFTMLARRLHREKLSLVFAAFFIVTLGLYSAAISWRTDWVAWTFYLYGDLYSTIMVATFFAFLNDSFAPESAKRLYGPIIFGGVLGGSLGSWFLAELVDAVSQPSWMWICAGLNVAIAVLAWIAGILAAKPSGAAREEKAEEPAPKKAEKNAAIEGASLVLRSPYLLSIVGIVGLYEIVSTVLDFQFSATVTELVPQADMDNHFTTVYAITNGASLFVQLVVATAVLNFFRLRVALLMTPFVILAASIGFMAVPVLWVGSFLNTADGAFAYSINQSAREALYTPTTRDEKYKAKAFIDMFVQRFAKSIAVFVTLLITSIFTDFSSVRWLSVVTIVVVALWMGAAWYAGGRFRQLTGEDGKPR
jgi:AAA family ATP:ADP antiporter